MPDDGHTESSLAASRLKPSSSYGWVGPVSRKLSLSRRYPSFLLKMLALCLSSPFLLLLSATLTINGSPAVFFFAAEAVPTNITIDDTNSAFTFESEWVAGPCHNCAAQLDQNLTYDGTWHDGGARTGLSGQLKFSGTAVYLYGVTSQDDTGAINFTIDGQSTKPFDPSFGVPAVVHAYNFNFLSLTGLSNASHTLGFTAILAANTSQTVLIDYATVTFDNSSSSSGSQNGSGEGVGGLGSGTPPSPKKSSNKSALIGGIVGGIAGAILLLLVIFFFIRGRKHRSVPVKKETNIEPFQTGNPAGEQAGIPSSTSKARLPAPTTTNDLLNLPLPLPRAETPARSSASVGGDAIRNDGDVTPSDLPLPYLQPDIIL
ncbi:hypothetical protein D9757_009941 [Collybiopsis confluens]|uniref:Uncharacterized protein n=1 Tax=Collybiopsis confluens TaxID=2823264 RepID=A0A8H5H2H7_9AGAR|nr:hypothetical protein D9757_009941 [Collybiopsis confluens]